MKPARALIITVSVIALVALAAVGVIGLAAWQVRDFWLKPAAKPSYSAGELYTKAQALISTNGDYAQAETYLEQALSQQNDNTYRTQLAVVKYRLKKYEESIVQYRLFADTGGDAAFAQNGIGNAYRDWAGEDAAKRAEYAANALIAYAAAIAADPKYVAAYANRGQLLAELGRSDEAKAVFAAGIAATASKELEQIRGNLFGS